MKIWALARFVWTSLVCSQLSHAAIFVSVISKTEIVMALQFWMRIKNFYGQSGNRKSSTECRNVLPR